ncbi:hypothetical protein CH380_02530 [Leptospira adleri]|uniref:Uncharacterized protein n=1 Tax=Leptospira adleri TaxID=2023186 RepID=A0A2M9YSW9_9LEPT|nr:hypothetical protein CH380_02530 [Leptospira adleri]
MSIPGTVLLSRETDSKNEKKSKKINPEKKRTLSKSIQNKDPEESQWKSDLSNGSAPLSHLQIGRSNSISSV